MTDPPVLTLVATAFPSVESEERGGLLRKTRQ